MIEQIILTTALEKVDPAEQQAYLDEACAGDPELRRRLDELLRGSGEITASLAISTPVQTEEIRPDVEGAGRADLRFLGPPAEPGHLGRLDHYQVLEVIGRGGFGIVLRAVDEQLRRHVAIKVLAPHLASNGTARKRFVREAQAAAGINHENVVAVHSVNNAGALPYLVMQYIPGISLQQKIDRTGPPELEEILRVGSEIASGLAAAHARGLVHRDVKPANILLEEGTVSVKITDFGLARTADDASLTQSGVIAGTPMYMSPEQAQGESVDHRSDLFSLGSVLYLLATGRPPFRAGSTVAVLRRVCNDTPRPIRELSPEIPDWLCDLISRLHAKKPEDRFSSAAEVAELLAKALGELRLQGRILTPLVQSTAAEPEEVATESVPRIGWRRRPLWVALLMLAGLVILIASGVTGFPGTAPSEKAPHGVTKPTRKQLLLCLFNPYRVVGVDDQGKELFEISKAQAACGCAELPDGRRVFADFYGQCVLETNAKDEIVRRFPLPGSPNSLHLLPGGNLLVGLYRIGEVVELRPDGQEVWRVAVGMQPTDARRLANGRTLVALFGDNTVLEVDREGKVVWQVQDVPSPESARRLDSGNTLVACSTGSVREYSPAGKLVWSVHDVPKAYDAIEQKNGNVLIGYESGLREVTRTGEIVRELAVGTVRRIAD